ncbi:hypothetical protein DM02DRAFT_663083 [Periconia macrospinosa]|uniref:Uncharacterized protein n=1 Tax=Periconia macrospinosa TaxID=97972 RepID=A0A2V1D2P0_9PLEO|nr:hypothetical protein DM02DRAFT_663083 [Periconia macrospinosa]
MPTTALADSTQEKTLKQEMDSENDSTNFYANSNRALYSIASHLHRYRSELNSLEATITNKSHQLTEMRHIHESTDDANRRIVHELDQTGSQVKATNDFSQELEKKLSNILAWLFNRMQIAKTQAMNVVLRAIQTDTQTSQRLSEEMQKDSLSMKMIAVVTMFFLPGATFAGLLSMPFLAGSAWVSSISRIWLWFVFTIPTTTFFFLFYWYYKRQGEKRTVEKKKQEERAKLEAGQV